MPRSRSEATADATSSGARWRTRACCWSCSCRRAASRYLFPDTYAFDAGTAPADIVRAMVQRFRAESADLSARREIAGLSEAEMVTLASVIEKETGQANERPLISGVFHNRLRLGMPLQSDPTVLYGRGGGRGALSRADLASAQPYNTYVHRGLPPGPIANPGRAALEAAVAPAPTAALYFVSRNDGSHAFSETLEAHNRAVRPYQPNRD
ncbi:MAG: endolytic transglycosylase MltG [Candidatus Binatia bacterium]